MIDSVKTFWIFNYYLKKTKKILALIKIPFLKQISVHFKIIFSFFKIN